jgi:glycosyltransferase involved in cell wall biosynthesis
MTLLSIVTPVYNQARYVEQTLDSVAALATPHEHIVIDGGSDDGTVATLEQRDGVEWVSEPDRGQTHAVNKGLERSTGDLVAWLNGDDAYVAEAVDRAVAHLERHPQTSAVYGGMQVTDADDVVRRTYIPAEWSWRRYLVMGDYVPTPTFIFRRALLEERGLLDERWRDAADYDFYLRLLRGVRVDRMAEPLVRFRFHEASKTASDVWVQQDEALAIRLRFARNPLERGAMRAFDHAKRVILPRISPWPATIPDHGSEPGAWLVRVLDRYRAARNR